MMWIWTVDEKLVNLALVESVEFMEAYPTDAAQEAIDGGEVEPLYFEVIAVLPSGREMVLFEDEDESLVLQAVEVLVQLLGAVATGSGAGQVVSLDDLMRKTSESAKN